VITAVKRLIGCITKYCSCGAIEANEAKISIIVSSWTRYNYTEMVRILCLFWIVICAKDGFFIKTASNIKKLLNSQWLTS
jgi:hypothetical protein